MLAAGAVGGLLYGMKKLMELQKNEDVYKRLASKVKAEKGKNKAGKGNVDKVFLDRVIKLIKIAIPGVKSKEFIYIVLLTFILWLRTYMSILLAEVNGKVVKAIVNRSLGEFLKRIFILGMFSIPASAVNSGMDYF